MTDQTRIRKYEVNDFVSTPIGMLSEVGSSMGDVNEVPSPPIPSFYRGPDREESETQQATGRAH
jgi:hypothetical protein